MPSKPRSGSRELIAIKVLALDDSEDIRHRVLADTVVQRDALQTQAGFVPTPIFCSRWRQAGIRAIARCAHVAAAIAEHAVDASGATVASTVVTASDADVH